MECTPWPAVTALGLKVCYFLAFVGYFSVAGTVPTYWFTKVHFYQFYKVTQCLTLGRPFVKGFSILFGGSLECTPIYYSKPPSYTTPRVASITLIVGLDI